MRGSGAIVCRDARVPMMVRMPLSDRVVVDSFACRDARVVNPLGHVRRTMSGVREMWAGRVPVERLHADVSAAYASLGAELEVLARDHPDLMFFPKLEFRYNGSGLEATWDPRPISPESVGAPARLLVYPHADARAHPRIKGPDFAFQDDVRQWARSCGADDALMHRPEAQGEFAEAAYASVVAIEPGLVIRSRTRSRLPSTSEAALASWAMNAGWRIEERPLTLALLTSAAAVWMVSALHTIREVTHVDDHALTRIDVRPVRERVWQMATPVSTAFTVVSAVSSQGAQT